MTIFVPFRVPFQVVDIFLDNCDQSILVALDWDAIRTNQLTNEIEITRFPLVTGGLPNLLDELRLCSQCKSTLSAKDFCKQPRRLEVVAQILFNPVNLNSWFLVSARSGESIERSDSSKSGRTGVAADVAEQQL